MLIEVVHINGIYSPETGEHTSPDAMQNGYYEELASRLHIASELGSTVLYRPNLMNFSHDIFGDADEFARAIDTDPFLVILGEVDGLHVLPDGRKPLERVRRDVAREDALASEHRKAVILGAYLGECVPSVAWDLASRNPRLPVGVDLSLSINRGARNIRPEFERIPHTPIPGI